MTKEIKNTASSIRNKLLNISRKEKKNFDLLLMLYMQERLLYRISISSYEDKFVLKGGLFLFSITNFKGRPTKDIDFLAQQISNDIENIKQVFENICKIKYEDGVIFDHETIMVERIKEGAEYEGIRVKVNGSLDKAKKMLQLDIGFGDIVIPRPEFMKYPTLLDMDSPLIKVYSIESVIAEKFEAMIKLSIVNSRMKDFFDIHSLSQTKCYDGRKLQEAISETFQRRGTILEKNTIVFSSEFILDHSRQQMWKSFLKRIGEKDIEFSIVMARIQDFIGPIYDSIIREEEFFGIWDNDNFKWSKA